MPTVPNVAGDLSRVNAFNPDCIWTTSHRSLEHLHRTATGISCTLRSAHFAEPIYAVSTSIRLWPSSWDNNDRAARSTNLSALRTPTTAGACSFVIRRYRSQAYAARKSRSVPNWSGAATSPHDLDTFGSHCANERWSGISFHLLPATSAANLSAAFAWLETGTHRSTDLPLPPLVPATMLTRPKLAAW